MHFSPLMICVDLSQFLFSGNYHNTLRLFGLQATLLRMQRLCCLFGIALYYFFSCSPV